MLNLLQVRLGQLGNVGSGLTIVHFVGRFVAFKDVDTANAEVKVNVLFDTGALCANYVSVKKYQMRGNNIINEDDIIRQRTCIGLADNATKVYSDIMLEIPIQFQGTDGAWQNYDGIFVVLDMKENEVIIGLPAIIAPLWNFFTSSMQTRIDKSPSARLQCMDPPNDADDYCVDIEATINMLNDLREPWAINPREECPEEVAVGVPAQFE